MGDRLELVLINDLSELERLATAIDDFVERNALPPELTFTLTLCLDELFTNSIRHGYADASRHLVHIRLESDETEVRAELEDDGIPFNPFADAPPPILSDDIEQRRPGGLGVFLVKESMDRVAYRREGGRNRIQLAKALTP
ncbi:ATP-binding protein [Azospirillum doebereinerae]|nr:ATP-binding protein [Azospirillum doebereinerae]MCG5239178.1 ATP-binding protein [Azospirillum doebereinerae]